MSTAINDSQKNELRHCVLEILAHRHPAAFTAEQVHRRAGMVLDFPFDLAATQSALAYLGSMESPRARAVADELGGGVAHWQATASGLRQHEAEKQGA